MGDELRGETRSQKARDEAGLSLEERGQGLSWPRAVGTKKRESRQAGISGLWAGKPQRWV